MRVEEERSQEILFEAIGEDLLHHKTLSTAFYEIQSQALQDICQGMFIYIP